MRFLLRFGRRSLCGSCCGLSVTLVAVFAAVWTSFSLQFLLRFGRRSLRGVCFCLGVVLVAILAAVWASFSLRSLLLFGLRSRCDFCCGLGVVLFENFAVVWAPFSLRCLMKEVNGPRDRIRRKIWLVFWFFLVYDVCAVSQACTPGRVALDHMVVQ